MFFISGDWPFFFREQLARIGWLPDAYRASWGFGENVISRLWVDYPFHVLTKALFTVGFPWVLTEKLWLTAPLLLAFASSFALSGHFFRIGTLRWLSSITYAFNTYFFLILGGGQLGVAMGYAIAPYALLAFIRLTQENSWRRQMQAGGTFAALVACDLRIGYLIVLACLIYSILQTKNISGLMVLAGMIIFALPFHLYWVLPILLVGGFSLPSQVGGTDSLSFFSVADFSHTLSLLHPNWPENLFGRVYFQKPEFILIPVLAFGALVFRNGKRAVLAKPDLSYFAILGLVGAFLGKGTNEPFGTVYTWLYAHVPGFVMFRDPTKFYVLIALSYSILIPAALAKVSEWRKVGLKAALAAYLVGTLFLFRGVIFGKTSHSFQFFEVPNEYERLKNILASDPEFSRVLWVPTRSHFSYGDATHPGVDAAQVFGDASPLALRDVFGSPVVRERMGEKGVGYVVVPTDEGKNIYLTDYTYDDDLRRNLINALDASGLPKDRSFTQLAVYRNAFHRGLFELETGLPIIWHKNGANMYEVEIPKGSQNLTMLMAFDPGWRLVLNGVTMKSLRSNDGWTRFALTGEEGVARIYFTSDRVAGLGALVSGMTLLWYGFIMRKKK